MRIILETEFKIDTEIKREIDSSIYRVNNEDIFEDGNIVLDKYASIIRQLHYGDGIYINTIFSFLLKLKSDGRSLYYKQLHTRLLQRIRKFLEIHRVNTIYLYSCSPEMREYLSVECFEYTEFNSKEELIRAIKRNNF